MSRTKNSGTTSNGRRLSSEELTRAYGRIHKLLFQRFKDAKKRKVSQKRAAQDLLAYERILEVCQNMTKKLKDLEARLKKSESTSSAFMSVELAKKGRLN